MESNDSPEIPDKEETSDEPSLPSGSHGENKSPFPGLYTAHNPPSPPPKEIKWQDTDLALARPWASRSTVGTPSLTKRVKSDCSMLENFWKAMFLMTGGSWWWSPIMIHRFSRLLPSSGFWDSEGIIKWQGAKCSRWDGMGYKDGSAAAYMAGSLKTVAHTILSPLWTYWVTLSVQLRNATTQHCLDWVFVVVLIFINKT